MRKRSSRAAVAVQVAVLLCVACQSDGPAESSSQMVAGGGGAPEGIAGAAVGGRGAAGGVAPIGGRAADPIAARAGGPGSAMAAAGSSSAAGGSMAPSIAAAGAGAAAGAAAPAAPTAGAAAPELPACDLPPEYTRASRATIELIWPATIGIEGGTGTLIAWSKIKYIRQPDGTTRTESHACGTLTPTVTTSAVAGGLKSSMQVPLTAYDQPSMPMYSGTLTAAGTMSILDPGPMVIGAALSDDSGAWPATEALMPFDHDGDGAPGLTALPITGAGYLTPPSSVSQTEFLDGVYIASRVRLKVPLAENVCASMHQAALEPVSFDYTIVGCHVEARGDCTAAETRFISTQSPKFKAGKSGSWLEAEVAASATCADVRAALPPP